MAHVIYENEVLANKLEDTLITNLSINNYVTFDNSLEGQPGMKKTFNTYKPTSDSIEVLAMGQGNTKTLEAGFESVSYEVKTYQGRMSLFDEQVMTDPNIVDALVKFRGEEMTNYFTKLAVDEWRKASVVHKVNAWSFEAVVDAIAKLGMENETGLFLMVSVEDKAEIRKALKDDLVYSEAYVRTGYIGTVCGVPVIVTKALKKGEAFLATKEAVTVFTKKDTEVRDEREENIRKSTYYIRKYGFTALTDATKVVKISVGASA